MAMNAEETMHKPHPPTTAPTTAPAVVEPIVEPIVEPMLALSLQHPAWGGVRLCAHRKLEGVSVSSPSIQRLLIKPDLGSKLERRFTLEAQVATEPIDLSAEQITQIETANPGFRERHVESSRPGEVLCQDTVLVGLGRRR
jgi:hypothetical protein